MDLASSCKDKLTYFRIKELKDVLAQLGLAKQGKKQDLVDRILSVFSGEQGSRSHGWAKKSSLGKEGLAKIIDDTYRKLQVHGATDLASKGQNGSSLSSMKPKDEVEFSFQSDMKIRCPCGSSLVTDSIVKCEGRRCNVWQHMGCVFIPEKPMEGVRPEVPSCFYCEICRLSQADPFWESVAHPLFPVKMTVSNLPTDGSNPVQNVEKTFQLSRADRDLLLKTEYDLQAWCILLNDKVTFRMQWPQYSDLQVNGVPIRTTNRPVSQLLGISGRDDGPAIKTCCREGTNKISLTALDARIFCIGVRIVRRRTVQQVLNLIPKESDGENFEEALARVRRCIGGGAAAENADSDSDLEVVADSVTVNLRCPMSGSRMKIAGRFKPCAHMGCFDLQTFVELNQRSRKWQCPICLQNYSLENMIIDPYFNRITLLMQDCGEDVNEIEVKPDGSWRAKNESERRDLAQWHSPNGSLCVTTDGGRLCELETLQQLIKEEFSSDERTTSKIGIKRNHNGLWEVSKPEDKRPILSGNHIAERLEDHRQKVLPMSSSATGSYRDGEDPSVNQEGGGQFDFSITNGNEHDSAAFDFGTTYGAMSRVPSVPLADPDVIVLSDSEEEDANMESHQTVYYTGPDDVSGIPLPIPPAGVTESYPEDHDQCPGLFTSNNDVFEMALWSQAGSDLHLFGTGADVSDTLVDIQNTPASFPATINGYVPSTNTIMGTVLQVEDPLAGQPNTETDGLVDNHFLFDTDDPSLQIFLPSHPAGVPVQMDAQNQTDISNGIRSEDWISLRLGGGGSESAERHSSNLRKQRSSNEGRMGISDNINYTGSLLQSLNNDDDDVRRRPFSHPRQPRSVRQRLHLSL